MQNGYEFEGYVVKANSDSLLIDNYGNEIIIFKKNIKDILQLRSKVVTSDGKKLNIHISQKNDDYIIGADENNVTHKIKQSDVVFLETENAFEQEPYSMLGLTAFFPGGINLQYGRHINRNFGFRIHLGTTIFDLEDNILGVQVDFLFNLTKKQNFEQNLSLALGHTIFEGFEPDLSYLGVLYDFNFHGFFMQFGPAFSLNDNYSTLQIVGNIGLVFRFN
jgi:hypothetical protein